MPSPFIHDPQAVLDYYIDWHAWLVGDTITDSAWTTDDTDITVASDAIVGDYTQVWLDGGAVGSLVTLTNHITTAAGREDDRTLRLVVRQR